MKTNLNRRTVLKTGAAAGALFSPALSPAEKEASGQAYMHHGRLIRVGVLCVGSDSHLSPVWGQLINPKKDFIRQTGMIMTHCWDIDPAVREEFSRTFGCTPVRNYYDMVNKVDGVIHGGYASHPVNHLLVEPYLQAGIPVYINRPFTNSLVKARHIIDIAKSSRTPVMCGSAFEYTREINIIRDYLNKPGGMTGYNATNSMSDYSTHGIHGVYLVYRCIGGPVSSVSYQTPDWEKPNGLMTFEHPGREGGNPFYGTLQQIPGGLTNASIRVYRNRADYFEQMLFWEKGPYDRYTHLHVPLLIAMQRMFATGAMPEPYENIYEKTLWYLAGFKSHLEHGGAPVAVHEVPPDWEAPVMTGTKWKPAVYRETDFE